MDLENEEWRPIAGQEGAYEVSNLGRVRSLPRVVPHGASGKIKWGHEYTPENTKLRIRTRTRLCRTCEREGYYIRKAAAGGSRRDR